MTDIIQPGSPIASKPDVGRGGVKSSLTKSKRRKKRDIGALVGAVWIGLVVVAALSANWLPIPNPNEITGNFGAAPGLNGNPLGTDTLGRDVLSRCLHGAQVSMVVALGGTLISMVVGVTLGMLAGYLNGKVDRVISFFINFLLSFPALIFLIALVAAVGPSLRTLVLGLALLGVPNFARVARANAIAFAGREFVTAAKALGAGPWRILTRELLINVMLPVMSLALVVMATLVVAEGSLSFLGLGIPPPTPSWGGMLAEGKDSLQSNPYLVLVPSLFFFLTVFAFNRLGDWVRGRIGRESAV